MRYKLGMGLSKGLASAMLDWVCFKSKSLVRAKPDSKAQPHQCQRMKSLVINANFELEIELAICLIA